MPAKLTVSPLGKLSLPGGLTKWFHSNTPRLLLHSNCKTA